MSQTHQLYFYYSNGEKSFAIGMSVDLSMLLLPPSVNTVSLPNRQKLLCQRLEGGKMAEKKLEKVHSDIIGPEDVGTPYMGRNTC